MTILDMRDTTRAEREPMSRKTFEDFIYASLARMKGADKDMDAVALLAEVGGDQASAAVVILVSRLLAGDSKLRFSMMTALFLSCISSNPARAVMWAHYLVRRSYETGSVVEFDVLADDFPMGFPTDEGASRIWDAQKGACGNRLDQREAWRYPIADVVSA